MKKIALLAIMAISAVSVLGQAHQSFKGMPIDGKKSDFISALKSKGFTEKESNSYVGKFAGYDGCTVRLFSIPESDIMYKVSVEIQVETPFELEENFERLKEMLTEKYGNPIEEDTPVDDMDYNANSQNVLEKMLSSLKIATTRKAVFDTKNGIVELSGIGIMSTINISYIDKQNVNNYKQSVIDDL